MMKKILAKTALIGLAAVLVSCFGQHNKYPSTGANLESARVYGMRGAEPLQLPTEYPDPEIETLERIEDIRTKLFPE